MYLLTILDIIGFIFGVLGAIMVGRQNRWGFISFVIGSLSHGFLGFLTYKYGIMATAVVFIVIDVYYFRKWGISDAN